MTAQAAVGKDSIDPALRVSHVVGHGDENKSPEPRPYGPTTRPV